MSSAKRAKKSEQPIRPVIIVTGPVGAGKSALAKQLVEDSTHLPTTYIEGDLFLFFTKKFDKENDTKEAKHQRFRTAMFSMLMAALPFARAGHEVILDFSIPPWYLNGIRTILKEVPFEYVVLKPAQSVCAQRAQDRSEGAIPDYAPYEDLYHDFESKEVLHCVVADNDATVTELAKRVRQSIDKEAFRMNPPTN